MMAAALFVVGVAMTGCKKDNNDVQEPAKVQTYKMSITASKGAENGDKANGPKKVLGLDGSTLTATWAEGEIVKVYKESTEVGSLSAESSGATTTLSGELTGTIEAGDELTLKFLNPSYASQDGTLEYISANCDYATATTTVSSVEAGTIYTESTANFVNQQAIVKFTLMKRADNSSVEIPAATALTINDGTNDYTVTPASATNVLFVAIPATNTMHLSSSFGGVTYSYDKTATDLLKAGQYYEIGVKMWREVNLAAISANKQLLNGDKVIGTLGGKYKISIAAGHKNQGNSDSECGAITISGGTVIATGGTKAAGIGCGYNDVAANTGDLICGDITITSGVTSVTATKGSDADNCIGVNRVANRTTCYSVTIGGTVYWGPAGATYYYANGGDTYLTNSLLVYPAP